MQIYPIHSQADYERALKEIAPFFDNPPADDDPIWDSVDIMVTRIEEYEKQHFPLADTVTAVDAIHFDRLQEDSAVTLLSPEAFDDFLTKISTPETDPEVIAARKRLMALKLVWED